jgi:hypothetical protein
MKRREFIALLGSAVLCAPKQSASSYSCQFKSCSWMVRSVRA